MNEGLMKVVALSGGVGGAKFVDGLSLNLPPEYLTTIVNIGDDFEHFGLKICPDVDTILYTLSGLANPFTGWGRDGETWTVMGAIEQMGGPAWFHLGDHDVAWHMLRTHLMINGMTLSETIEYFCGKYGIKIKVIPASNDAVPTMVHTKDQGVLGFQEYFVRCQFEPPVNEFVFANIQESRPAPGVLEALRDADLVLIGPSNPFVSIFPILNIPGIQEAITDKVVVAVSPIKQGKSYRGPAAKIFREMGMESSSASVANLYRGIIQGIVIDNADSSMRREIERWGIMVLETDITMDSVGKRKSLALDVIQFGKFIQKMIR